MKELKLEMINSPVKYKWNGFFSLILTLTLTLILTFFLCSLHNQNIVTASSSLPEIKDGNYLLALVTKQTNLGRYEPKDLVTIPTYLSSREMYLRREANNQLISMYYEAKSDNVSLMAVSAYRSYDYQKQLFDNYASEHGEEKANTFSARPGQSEHQLGTTVDFGGTNADWTPGFANTPAGFWLLNHAYKYGFALSYPANSEHITGYIYEPWHFRYIGINNAYEWKESGLVLSNFLKTKPQYYTNYPDNIPVISIDLKEQSLILNLGESLTLKPILKPDDATNKKLIWASDNPDVATVNAEGIVSAKGIGQAIITVTSVCGNKTVYCLVDVPYIAPESIRIDREKINMFTGGVRSRVSLDAVILPENTSYKAVIWETDNPEVLTVNNGILTAISEGVAIITVTTVDKELMAICEVTVEDDGIIYGDITGDGHINIIDAIQLLRHIVELDTIISEQIIAADVNGDGEITVADVICILRYIVGL